MLTGSLCIDEVYVFICSVLFMSTIHVYFFLKHEVLKCRHSPPSMHSKENIVYKDIWNQT